MRRVSICGFVRLIAAVELRIYRDGVMSKDRATRLASLPGWQCDVRAAWWDEGLAHLRRFVNREGHCKVPQGHMEGEYKLGQWVAVQRASYREGKLTPKRSERLQALPGWTWNTRWG
ncbi:MAG: helicase associated domain-containing protein [Gemmatimonadota bacterium]